MTSGDREELAHIIGHELWQDADVFDHELNASIADAVLSSLFIARLKGERGTALQAAQCYRAQRDLAWAEIDRLEEQLVEAKAESRHIANNLDVQRLGRKLAEAGGTVVGPSRDADTQTIMHHFDD